jgi:hypothetical protein
LTENLAFDQVPSDARATELPPYPTLASPRAPTPVYDLQCMHSSPQALAAHHREHARPDGLVLFVLIILLALILSKSSMSKQKVQSHVNNAFVSARLVSPVPDFTINNSNRHLGPRGKLGDGLARSARAHVASQGPASPCLVARDQTCPFARPHHRQPTLPAQQCFLG